MIPANRLDPDQCYRAVESKDARFDGCFFTAVRTTGIYCRPSCPAVTPKRQNVEFFPTAAAAHEHGYRACKRCRPDASPGSPEWDRRGDVVARAMRLVADGVVDRDGVAGLARHLHYSERHLNRLMVDELGAGPIAVARAQRATTARILIETTAMSFTAIAFAAGFGSVRQFNDTIREVFAATPGELRAKRRGSGEIAAGAAAARPGVVAVELAVREPYDLAPTLAFLSARAIAGVEHADDTTYCRSLALPRGHGVVAVLGTARTGGRTYVRAELELQDWRDLAPAVRRVRRLLDLDADPVATDALLRGDPALAPLVTAHPGRRVPGSSDPFETAVRAVVGQQVSVVGARTILGRITASAGDRLTIAHDVLTHVFPSPDAIAALDEAALPMPASRQRTLVELGARAAIGKLPLDVGADRDEARAALLDVPGIGPWTADYVMMRGFGDPDVFLPTDLGVVRGLATLGIDAARSQRWRPWRSYAMAHVWSADADPPPVPPVPAAREVAPVMTEHTTRHTFVDSPIGTLTLIADGDAIVEVWFANHGGDPTATLDDSTLDPDHPVLARASVQLDEYFAGTRTEFDLPLAPQGTSFQLAAWRALSTIPYGETVSYGEQAARLGDPNKARAVGAANGRNPIPIIVPCHRVIGANGHLTGFGGGVESKAWLLDHEQRVRRDEVA